MARGAGAMDAGETSACGCLMPIAPCLFGAEELARRDRSRGIDRQLARERDALGRTHRLLLLGAGESGKSTFLKQMQLIHSVGEAGAWRRTHLPDIRRNLLEAMLSILNAMTTIQPPTTTDNDEHEKMAEWIRQLDPNDANSELFYQYTERLWTCDRGVQKTFERSNEYHLLDSAMYFLERIGEISRSDYEPTDQDVLRSRVLTTGIHESFIHVNNVTFHFIDVGGQRDERRKWFLCFNDVTAIIFVTACSSYNLNLREDGTKNRLRESLELFKIVWNNRWLARISVILFLNKQDLFREKILAGRFKLEDYFPDYREFVVPTQRLSDKDWGSNEHPEVIRAKYFVREMFEKISSNHHPGHRLYPHFTCAVDTENIKRVFEDCRAMIQIKNLSDFDLI